MKLQRLFFSSLILIGALYSGIGLAQQPAEDQPPYRIVLNLPEAMGWKVQSNTGMTSAGSITTYVPAENPGAETVTLMYVQGIQTSLNDSMEQIKTVMTMGGCSTATTDVITQQDDLLIFTTHQSGCADGKTLEQIFKVFHKDDGQYTVVYAANPTVVSEETREAMKKVVESATLTPTR
jgi:hypothetical protein